MCRHVPIWGFRNPVRPYPEKKKYRSFVNISSTLVIDTSMERSSRVLQHENPKIWFSFRNWILTYAEVLKSPELRQSIDTKYRNYASPTSGEAYRDRRLTTNFELWVEIFCVPTCFHMRIPKPCLSVCPHPEKRYHHSFVNISPTLVIDTSMERSSRVLHHGNPKIWFFFSKKFEIRNLSFDEELKSP